MKPRKYSCQISEAPTTGESTWPRVSLSCSPCVRRPCPWHSLHPRHAMGLGPNHWEALGAARGCLESGLDGSQIESSVRASRSHGVPAFVDSAQCQCHWWVFERFGGGLRVINILPPAPYHSQSPWLVSRPHRLKRSHYGSNHLYTTCAHLRLTGRTRYTGTRAHSIGSLHRAIPRSSAAYLLAAAGGSGGGGARASGLAARGGAGSLSLEAVEALAMGRHDPARARTGTRVLGWGNLKTNEPAPSQ